MADKAIVDNCALQVTFYVTLLIADAVGAKFSIDRQVDQIFKIIMTQSVMETSDLKMVMTPADFNFLIPFSVKMSCGAGFMIVNDMRRVHQEDIYMDAINENETVLHMRFTVSEIDFRWDLCWLSLVIPVPMWLRGKIFQSTYEMSTKITYEPNCELTVTKVNMESYGKISLNIFNWLPRGLGDKMSEMLARNTQDRIHVTVTKSIVKTVENMTSFYDPCIAFPAMGRLKELPQMSDDLFEDSEELDNASLTAEESEKDAGNVLGEQETILVDELQGSTHDQIFPTISVSSTYEDSEEENYGGEMRSEQQNRIQDESMNDIVEDCSKFEPIETPAPHSFYDTIRKQAELNLEKLASSIDKNDGIEQSRDFDILEETGNPKRTAGDDEERLTVNSDEVSSSAPEYAPVDDIVNQDRNKNEEGSEDTSNDGEISSSKPSNNIKSEL